MKIVLCFSLFLGVVFAKPATLENLNPRGYDYKPPEQPSGLYDLPDRPSDRVTVTAKPTTTPRPPPVTTPKPPPPTTPKPDKTGMMLMPYDFRWAVEDLESGNMFNHIEDSDGINVKGEYSVLLPDGQMQYVKFESDPENGYRAEVTYKQLS